MSMPIEAEYIYLSYIGFVILPKERDAKNIEWGDIYVSQTVTRNCIPDKNISINVSFTEKEHE